MSTTQKIIGASKVEVSTGKERIMITTHNGLVYEIIVAGEKIEVFSSSGLGSGLVVKPVANSKIILSQDEI